MKKVSFLLAVLLVLTCCMLAACGGDEDTSSTETSSAATDSTATSSEETTSEASSAAEETTTPADDSSVEDTTTEPDEGSQPDDDSSTAEPPAGYDGPVEENPDGANLALNKSYTGANPSTHPANGNYNASLTDGAAMDKISYDQGNWFAYYFNPDAAGDQVNAPDKVGSFVLDLEKVYAISSVKLNTYLGNTGDGILPPKSIKVEYSTDGSSYSTLAEKTFPTASEGEKTEAIVEFLEFKGEGTVAAQYIRVTVELQGIFAFINEVEVY